MKKGLFHYTIVTMITAGILLAGNAQANYINPVTESKLVKVCEAIKSGRLIKVHVAVIGSGIGIKLTFIY
jgi:hypothetical protein